MIRFANINDFDEIIRMAEAFHKVSGYAGILGFDREVIFTLVTNLINQNSLLISKGGMIGFVVSPMPFSKDLVSQELFWWVDPEYRNTKLGLQLLAEAEVVSQLKGAKFMSMVCLEDLEGDKVGSLYTALGFTPKEKAYIKKLGV